MIIDDSKCASKSPFSRFGVEIRCWSCKCGAVVRNSIVFCNSGCRSQWNGCVKVPRSCRCKRNTVLLCFASESRESHCNGCMKVANGALAADFFYFGTDGFPLEIPFKKCFKIAVFPLWRRDPLLELQIAAICGAVVRNSSAFRNSVCRSQWNGCVKVPLSCSCKRNTILFCI